MSPELLSLNEYLVRSAAIFFLLISAVAFTPINFLRAYLWPYDRPYIYAATKFSSLIWTGLLAFLTPHAGANSVTYYWLLIGLAAFLFISSRAFDFYFSLIFSDDTPTTRSQRLDTTIKSGLFFTPIIRALVLIYLVGLIVAWWLLSEFHSQPTFGLVLSIGIVIFYLFDSILECSLFAYKGEPSRINNSPFYKAVSPF